MLTVTEYQKLTKKSKNKYNAKKTMVDGIPFDSKREADRYCELLLCQKAGMISDLELQPKYELIPKQKDERAVTYKADFRYKERGKTVVEDVKSVATKTKDYIIKRKLLKYLNKNIDFREV